MNGGVPSLKRRLLSWLLVPLGMMATALILEAYLSARKTAEQIHDKILVTTAISISEHTIASGGDLMPDEILGLISDATNERVYYLITGPGSSFITGYSGLPKPPENTDVKGGVPRFYNAVYNDVEVRVVTLTFLIEDRDINGWMSIQVAKTLDSRNPLVVETATRAALRIFAVIGLAVVLSWIGISQGLAPLEHLQTAIKRRSYDDLRPIEQALPNEVHHVVRALNQLLERLAISIESSQRFIADASHQLRTPLSALQAKTELALRAATTDEERILLKSLHDGTQKTTRLANQLLSLAQTRPESGGELRLAPLDLNRVSADITEEWVRRALENDIDLGLDGSDEPLIIDGNETLIREMVSNLIDNAIRYGDGATSITIRTGRNGDGSSVFVDVEDDGPGVPDELKEPAFERFVRGDERDGDGCGLGLAIVREVARRHQGSASLRDTAGGGLTVHIDIPAHSTPAN